MFGLEDLKEKIEIENDTIVCPVRECSNRVRKIDKKLLKLIDSFLERKQPVGEKFPQYFCSDHRIFITPTTFIYEDFKENLLWKDEEDIILIEEICKYKRIKAQLHHDNSEDAVTWNVFRYLEKNNLLQKVFEKISGSRVKNPEIIYWSYSSLQKNEWEYLKKARREFEEDLKHGSEPDLIIKTDNTLFFVEAKLQATNETLPKNPDVIKKYSTGGNKWFEKVFISDCETVAIKEKKYELMRFWLLGTWIAKQLNLDFYLVNLTLSENEKDIEKRFKPFLKETPRRKFVRIVWEDIYQDIIDSQGNGKNKLLHYFKNKTRGYNSQGELKKLFYL